MDAQTNAFLLSYAYVAKSYLHLAIQMACDGCNGGGSEHSVCVLEDNDQLLDACLEDLLFITNEKRVINLYGALAQYLHFTIPMALQVFVINDAFFQAQTNIFWQMKFKEYLLRLM